MNARGLGADEEAGSDLPVGPPGCHQGEDLPLPWRQGDGPLRRAGAGDEGAPGLRDERSGTEPLGYSAHVVEQASSLVELLPRREQVGEPQP